MLIIKTDETATNDNLEYLELDYGVIRGVTTGLIDFSHPDTFGADYSATAVPAGTSIAGLTSSAGSSVTIGEMAAFTDALVLGANDGATLSSADFKHPTDGSVTDAVQIFWFGLPVDGYDGSASGASNVMLFGDGNSTSDNYGRLGLVLTGTTSDEGINSIEWAGYGQNVSFDASIISSLTSGVSQVAIHYSDDGTTATVSTYLNGS